MEKRMVNIQLGAILPTTKIESVVAALFNEVKGYELVSVKETETVLYWGYGVEVRVRMERDEIENVPDDVELANGRDLNVLVNGRSPGWYWCHRRGHVKKNCQGWK